MTKKEKMIQLKPGEEILHTVRESLAPQFLRIVLIAFWFFIPFFFLFPLFAQGTMGMVVFFLLVFSALGYGSRWFIRWRETKMVVTDERLFDIEQRGYFDTVVSEFYLRDVTDIAYRTKGMWAKLFRYGAVRVSAKHTSTKLVFSRVKNPARLHNLLMDLREHAHTPTPPTPSAAPQDTYE